MFHGRSCSRKGGGPVRERKKASAQEGCGEEGDTRGPPGQDLGPYPRPQKGAVLSMGATRLDRLDSSVAKITLLLIQHPAGKEHAAKRNLNVTGVWKGSED